MRLSAFSARSSVRSLRSVRSARVAVPAALAAAGVLLLAVPASAHVTVQPGSAAAGAADQVFAFRVPNESDTASTVKVDVFFPTDHPIASALVEQVPGWTATVQTAKLTTPIQTDDGPVTNAVSEITWTGGKIAPGQYQDFTVDFGQLPTDTKQLSFKTLQTYSDGTIVRWIDTPAAAGQPEPAHPAPTLNLTTASSDSTGGAASGSTGGTTQTAASTTSGSGSATDTAARVLAGVGLVVGVAGVAFGFLGWRRGGRRDSAA
ncbi:YcnI family copper-binding membrane protein [Streptacidiphilus fuscans]|uniref:YcnI family protein n=1 Tax=Streptacidiphilus fuscans TaxID=2789292 RepID=A0A931B480_9ACTN|nr:YcnI family protein [Streptacidiphilus fuscans]MBF9070829.1 YcnI family protein [Streptacidiphilus fuscans]